MTDFLHKLFFETKVTWKRVILFALFAGFLAAAVLIIPFTAKTSISYIGVTPECWILFALIIIMNCEKPLEAGLKTFVFFLISQPLIYLLQVPFYFDGWRIFQYYPRWFVWTVLCFPGAMIAWYVKKDNILSALILSVATAFLAAESATFSVHCARNFPKELVAAVFTLVLAVLLIFALLKNRRGRIIAGVITFIAAAAVCVLLLSDSPGLTSKAGFYLDDSHTWELTYQEGDIGEIGLESFSDNMVSIDADTAGTETVTFTNEIGESVTLIVTYSEEEGLCIEPIFEED